MSRRKLALALALVAGMLGAGWLWTATRRVHDPGLVVAARPSVAPEKPSTAADLPRGARGAPRSAQPAGTAPSASESVPSVAAGKPPAPAPQDTAQLRFRVVDDVGKPVQHVSLSVSGTGSQARGHRELELESQAGAYAVDLPPGPWSFQLRIADHWHAERTERDGETGRLNALFVRDVVLPLVADDDPLIVVNRAATVSGNVVDAGGTPVPGARLSTPLHAEGEADEEGRFELQVHAGPLALRATEEGRLPSASVALDLAPGERRVVHLALSAGGTLAGSLLEDGEPVGGAWVDTIESATGERVRVRTGADGGFTIAGLVPGEYRVDAQVDVRWSSLLCTVRDGERTSVVLSLEAPQTARLHGHVLCGGIARGGSVIIAARDDGWQVGAPVGPDGAFELRVPASASYELAVFAPGSEDGPQGLRRVDVPELTELAVDVEIACARIAGQVRGPDGPAARQWVRLSANEAGELLPSQDASKTVTDDAGRYAFERLAPGEYAVTAGGSSSAAARTVRHVDLGDGSVDDADLWLERGVRLSGTVTDEHGWSGPAAICVQTVDGRVLQDASTAGGDVRETSTDRSGTFRTVVLPDRPVLVVARSRTGVSQALAVPSPARAGALELTLLPAASLVVTCRDGAGRRVAATLSVVDGAGFEHAGAFRDVNEPWRLEVLLPPGAFTLAARAADGRVARRKVSLAAGEELVLELVLE